LNSFQELRYPFTSLVEFVGGGYWINRAGWHLTLGALFFAALVLWVWTRPGSPLERLIVVYFSTAIFNNPAYSLAGLRFGELAGVAAAVGVGAALFGGRPVDLRRVGAPLCLAALVLAAHAALVGALYPRIDPDAPTQVLRAVVVSRVMVLGLVILGIEQTFTRAAQFDASCARWCSAGAPGPWSTSRRPPSSSRGRCPTARTGTPASPACPRSAPCRSSAGTSGSSSPRSSRSTSCS
jgi:hypothetical protein